MVIPNLSTNGFKQQKGQHKRQIASALFIVNRSSGAGHTRQEAKALEDLFYNQFQPFIPHCLCAVTASHDEVQQVTHDFLHAFPAPWLLLSGGGSGTNRAQIQAIMDNIERGSVRPDDIYISALRLGSGNVIPKHINLPADPILALASIADGLRQGGILPCCVYRCVCHNGHGHSQTHYGATLASIGQFSRVPEDVAQWRQRHPQLMTQLLNHISLETVNNWQYTAFSLLRAVKCLLQPQRGDYVMIEQDGRFTSLRLFAGMLINFDFPPLPFQTDCLINESHLRLCLIPQTSRRQMLTALAHWQSLDNYILTYSVTPERPIDIHFLGDSQTTLALDEDIFVVPAHIRFEVAPWIRFVTGGG